VTTAEDLAFHGEPASLVVSQAQSSGPVHRTEDSVLLEQVVDDRLLVSIGPAGEQQEEEGERWRQPAHDWSVPERQPPRNACELGQPAPSQWAEISEANAFSDGVDRPVLRRSALGRVFAQAAGMTPSQVRHLTNEQAERALHSQLRQPPPQVRIAGHEFCGPFPFGRPEGSSTVRR
jgi:hypothetical protein